MIQKLECKTLNRKLELEGVLQKGGAPVVMAWRLHQTRNTYNNCVLKLSVWNLKVDMDPIIQGTSGDVMHSSFKSRQNPKVDLLWFEMYTENGYCHKKCLMEDCARPCIEVNLWMQEGAKSVTRMGIYGSASLWSSEDIKDCDDVTGSIGYFY